MSDAPERTVFHYERAGGDYVKIVVRGDVTADLIDALSDLLILKRKEIESPSKKRDGIAEYNSWLANAPAPLIGAG